MQQKSPTNITVYRTYSIQSGKRGSNSRPQPWQGCALPTELFPHLSPCQGWYLIKLGQGCALPTELFPRYFATRHFRRRSLCESELSHSLARKFRITAFQSFISTRHFRRRSLCESELSHSLARKSRVVFRLTGAKVVQNFKHAKLFEQKNRLFYYNN